MTTTKDEAIKTLPDFKACDSLKTTAAIKAFIADLRDDDPPELVVVFLKEALAATSHIAPDAAIQAEKPACRMQGGICACRSGGSYGGCAIERGITHQSIAPAIAPEASELRGFLMPEDAWNEYATRSGLLNEHGVAPHPATAQAAYLAYQAAWNCLHKAFSAYIAMHRAAAAKHPDDLAVDRFAAAMKAKMAASRAKGRGGWDDPEICPAVRLQGMLIDHLPKGDPVDVGNFAMMLFNRGERTTSWRTVPPCVEELAEMRALANGYVPVAEVETLRNHLADAKELIQKMMREPVAAAEPVPTSEAAKLAVILRNMCEGGDVHGDGVDIYADGYQAADGDVYVVRAAVLLERLAATNPAASEAVGVQMQRMEATVSDLKREVEYHKAQVHAAHRDLDMRRQKEVGEVWYWQHEGGNYVPSITCPIVIPAQKFRDLLAAPAAPTDAEQSQGDA